MRWDSCWATRKKKSEIRLLVIISNTFLRFVEANKVHLNDFLVAYKYSSRFLEDFVCWCFVNGAIVKIGTVVSFIRIYVHIVTY